ncbi:MAG: hypothetical protein NVSMB52_16230 [Chloroflexota bacterium]
MLIDAGMRGNWRKFHRTLKRERVTFNTVSHLLLTHWHIDHTGSAHAIKRHTGAQVVMHALDEPYLTGMEPPVLSTATTRRTRFVQSLLVRLYRTCPVDNTVDDGAVLPIVGGIRVIHVPGHTGGSVCYEHIPSRSLFLGDVLSRRGNRWSLPPDFFTADPMMARNSLLKLLDLKVDACYPGHGMPVLTNATASLQDGIEGLLAAADDLTSQG